MREADSRLLERSRAGEKGAFFELVRRHQSAVILLGFSLTGDRSVARDLSQETFLRAYRSLRAAPSQGTLGDWFFKLLRMVHDGWSRDKEFSFDRIVEDDPAESAELDQKRLAAYRIVSELLCTLPDDERRTVIRWHQSGRDARDVADALGETSSSIKSTIASAHKHLREKLEPSLDLTEFDR